MRFFSYFLVFCISSLQWIQAQGFVPGKLVLETGDTISGEIYFKSKDGIKDRFVVKDKEEERSYFKAEEVREIHVDSNLYIKAKPDKETVFLRLLTQGKISLYEYEYLRDFQGQYTKAYDLYFVKEGSTEFQSLSTSPRAWRKQLEELMQDHKDLVKQIGEKLYAPEHSRKVFELYNRWAAQQ